MDKATLYNSTSMMLPYSKTLRNLLHMDSNKRVEDLNWPSCSRFADYSREKCLLAAIRVQQAPGIITENQVFSEQPKKTPCAELGT